MSCHTKEDLEQMLFDVVDALCLSPQVIEEHGPLGTPPATLVKLVIEQKDKEIRLLKRGFVPVLSMQNERMRSNAPLERVNALVTATFEMHDMLRKHSTSQWDMDRVREYVEALFTRFAPWHPRERVRLCRPIDFDHAEGWRGSASWLQPGVIGEIMDIDYRNKKFFADVRFKEDKGHVYNLSEEYLELVTP